MTVVPATASFDEIMAHEPDGFFLSNGPGDPAATGEYAVPVIQADAGDQEAAVRHLPRPPDAGAGGRRQDVRRCSRATAAPTTRSSAWPTARVEITSMNHGFAVEREGLPDNVRETHVSLFDGSQLRDRADRPPGVQRAISPRGEPRAAGQLLSVREVRRGCWDETDAMQPAARMAERPVGDDDVASADLADNALLAELRGWSRGIRCTPRRSSTDACANGSAGFAAWRADPG